MHRHYPARYQLFTLSVRGINQGAQYAREPNASILKAQPGLTECHDDSTVLSLGTSVCLLCISSHSSVTGLGWTGVCFSGRAHGTG